MKIADDRRLGHRVVEACRAVLPADSIAHPSRTDPCMGAAGLDLAVPAS